MQNVVKTQDRTADVCGAGLSIVKFKWKIWQHRNLEVLYLSAVTHPSSYLNPTVGDRLG